MPLRIGSGNNSQNVGEGAGLLEMNEKTESGRAGIDPMDLHLGFVVRR
jgi:hypothetical protein